MSTQSTNDILSRAEVLNSKIKAIRSEKETREGRRKAYMEQLQQGCLDYKKQFGVDLWSEDLPTLFNNIKTESSREYQRLQSELEKKEQVVAAYEAGDLALMRRLLGISEAAHSDSETVIEDVQEVFVEEAPEVVEVVEPVVEVVEPVAPVVRAAPAHPQGTPTPKATPVVETAITGDFGFDFGDSLDEVIEEAQAEPETISLSQGFSFGDDDEPTGLKSAPPAPSGGFGFGDLLEGSTLSFD